MKEQKKTKSISVKTLLLSGAFILVVVLIGLATFAYFLPQNALAMRIRETLPYPALVINGTHPILFREVDGNVASIRRFYESQSSDLSKEGLRVDFSTPDGHKRLMLREKELLNKMIEDKAIEILAKQRNITITQNSVTKSVDQKISTLGNNKESVAQQLARLYGWTIPDFEQKVVLPQMYKDALVRVYAQGLDTSSQAKQKITAAENDLKQGTSFENVAKKYSEGQSAQNGGELGFIPVSNLAPEIKQAIQNQKINQVSNVVESSLGFHLVAVEERKQEQGQDTVRLKQIFAKKLTFSDWLTSQMKQMNIIVFFKGYMWDKDTARIEFNQPEMKLFEENAAQSSQGDASLFF
jgi:parvulin-like peptidyl-prolyl isomerase